MQHILILLLKNIYSICRVYVLLTIIVYLLPALSIIELDISFHARSFFYDVMYPAHIELSYFSKANEFSADIAAAFSRTMS